MTPIDLQHPPRGAFVFETEVFYDDLDGQMLLHHPRYLMLVERAQQSWFETVLEAPRFDWKRFPDMYHVVRRVDIDYLKPVSRVGDLSVVLWCQRLRAAGMSTGFVLQATDASIVYARGIRTNCRISMEDGRPLIWTDRFLERFETWEAHALASGLSHIGAIAEAGPKH